MRYHVNEDCIGCGLCAATCPDVFRLTYTGKAEAIDEDVAPIIEDDAQRAQDNCPVSAIETV